jgi:hypothetical protein
MNSCDGSLSVGACRADPGIVLALVSGGPPAQAKRSSAKAKQHPALKWEACEDAPAVQCSTLRVPLDWSRPEGPEVSLALTRLPARDRDHRVAPCCSTVAVRAVPARRS